MDSSSVNGMCRCCASEGAFKDIKTSYHWMGEEEVYGDMLRECFDVNLSSAEHGGICEVCITQLRNAANFKKQVLHTESQFKQHLRSKGFKAAQVKEEMSGFDDNDSDDMDNVDDEDYVPDYEVPIKTESESEEKPKKRAAKPATTRSKKSKSNDGEAAVKSFQSIIGSIARKGDRTGWSISVKKVKPMKTEDADPSRTKIEIEFRPELTVKRIQSHVKKPRKSRCDKANLELKPLSELLKKGRWCKRPPEPEVDQSLELSKHRHNIVTIMQYSNATPFRAYHVDDGFACCFCNNFFKKPSDLKIHTIEKHDSHDKNKFKESSTSIFTYVVKLDVTGLCCNLCNMEINTLEELIPHLQIHEIPLHTDIKDQIVCFKFVDDVIRCIYCSQEFSNFKFLLEHMNDHYRNYVCADCDTGFINYRMLLAHADGQDLTVGEVKCPTCNDVFDSLTKFKRHEILAHSGFDLNTHKCTHCSQTFKSDERLKDHVTKKHDGQHAYVCGGCKKTYPSKHILIAHTRRVHLHEEKQFKCDVCGKSFYERKLLKNHMIRHSITREYQCDACAKLFKSKKTLLQHIQTHKIRGEFKCLACEETFFRKTYLDDHMRQVHLKETRAKCTYCDKLLYQSQLKHHVSRRHSDKRQFKCEVCLEVCRSKYLLIQHMATHTDFKPHKKEFECLACGKKFDRKIYVVKHTQRVHLLEKKFVCDQCGKRFADTTTLKNHVATHSVENKFQCHGCPRTFKTKKTMMNHARNHMEERKVKCELCHQGFIYPYLLKDHMKQAHKILP